MKKENEEPCCGNCISFTNEGIYGDGFCCDKEEGTVCWEWWNKRLAEQNQILEESFESL